MYVAMQTTVVIALALAMTVSGSVSEDNGFGSEFEWSSSLATGIEEASARGVPLMLIVHKSWCGACHALKPNFAKSEPLQRLSRQFVMVNLMDDDEPKEDRFRPDGGYIPRILFLSPDGEVMTDVFNEMGSLQHKYFYSRVDDILLSMKKASGLVQTRSGNMIDNEEL